MTFIAKNVGFEVLDAFYLSHTHTLTLTHTHTHTPIHTCTHTGTRTHTQAHAHAHTHTHTHTHLIPDNCSNNSKTLELDYGNDILMFYLFANSFDIQVVLLKGVSHKDIFRAGDPKKTELLTLTPQSVFLHSILIVN
jgi:hypothetical protein